MLKYAEVTRSTFYYQLNRMKEPDKYKEVKEQITSIYHENKGRYGYRRMTLELHNRGFCINHKTVRRLMKELGLQCFVRVQKYKSYKGSESETVPNIIDRNFKAETTNVKWTTDITEFSLLGKKMYLSPLLDMYNGEIISYTIDYHPDLQLVIDMLNKALKRVKEHDGLIIHSDQGWHYQHKHYRHTLKKHKIIQSMSRKGNCLDNSLAENFFGLLKSELFYMKKYKTIEELEKDIIEYIDYYNNKRIQVKTKWMPPVKYRKTSICVA